MHLRRAALAVLGGLGAAAVTNATLERWAGRFDPTLEGSEHTYRWRGMDVTYTQAGDRTDQTILFLHDVGLTASSHEFADAFRTLADEYHVVAPDLPGYGRSDRPRIDYDAALYTDFVREFAADVTPGGICVATSLSGAYAAIAQRETGVFSRLILLGPTTTTRSIRRPLRERLLNLPVVGTAAFNIIASKPAIRYRALREEGGEHPNERDVDARWRAAHQPGARFAPAAFLTGRLDPDVSLAGVLEEIEDPVTLLWGRMATETPLSYGRDLASTANARLVVFDRGGSRSHVHHPQTFAQVLREELTGEHQLSERPE